MSKSVVCVRILLFEKCFLIKNGEAFYGKSKVVGM